MSGDVYFYDPDFLSGVLLLTIIAFGIGLFFGYLIGSSL